MSVYNDFLPYRDQYGFIQNNPQGNGTQNGALWSVEYLLCLRDNNCPELLAEITRLKEVFEVIEPMYGLSVRYPGSREYDSMDNATALLVYSHIWGDRLFAERMRDHGLHPPTCTGYDETQDPERNKKYFWLGKLFGLKNYWNNQHPDKWCFFGWYGRSPGFMGVIDIAATGRTTWFRSLALAIGQFIPLWGDHTGEVKLGHIVWQMLAPLNWRWKFLYWVWKKILMKKHPRGMKDVYASYFGDESLAIVRYTK